MTEQTRSTIIQMHNVVKAYQTGDGPFLALKDVNLEVLQGEFLGITGKSGAGKTTLLNLMSGVSDVSSGEVLFHANGNGAAPLPIHTLSEDRLAKWAELTTSTV